MTESGFFNVSDMQPPSEWNKFTGLRLIHRSHKGFDEVYVAKKNGKLHIIKTLKESYRQDPLALAALRKEFDLGFRVESAYVSRTLDFVDVIGVGKSIITDFSPGSALSEVLRSPILFSDHEALDLIDKLIKGIGDIHSAGIIHHDIKPSNIIYDRRSGVVKIIDFGCADSSEFTILKCEAGTPGYIPPTDTSSINADFYALGVTCSEIAEHCKSKSMKRRLLAAANRWKDGKDGLGLLRKQSRRKYILFLIPLILTSAVMFFFSRQTDTLKTFSDQQADYDSIIPCPFPITSQEIEINPDTTPKQPIANTITPPVRAERNQTVNVSTGAISDGANSDMTAREQPVTDTRKMNFHSVNRKNIPYSEKVVNATDSLCLRLWNILSSSKSKNLSAEECEKMLSLLGNADLIWDEIKKERADIAQGDTAHAHSLVVKRHYSHYRTISASLRNQLERSGKLPKSDP